MTNLWTCLGVSIIFYIFVSINGEPFNGTDWLTEISDPRYEEKLQNLQMEIDKLKLRLEFFELNMMKQQNQNMKTENKWQSIDEHLTEIDQQLAPLISNSSPNDAINATENITVGTNRSPMDDPTSSRECLPDTATDMNTTLNMFQEIQLSLAKIENNCSIEPLLELIKDERAMLNTIGKEKPLTCIRKADNKLVCSDDHLPTSCANCVQNPCRIQNLLLGLHSFIVPCNDSTDGGGWTVIQRRVNDSVDFYRDWSDYKQGFGDLDGNYWIGLDKLHALTTTLAPVDLRIDLMDFDNVVKYAKYNSFKIGNESTKYIMENVGEYSGTAGDSFSGHKNKKFSTRDQDNNKDKGGNSAQRKHGAWWYFNGYYSNLNGQYHNTSEAVDRKGIAWGKFHGYDYSLKFVQMMIRPSKS